MGRRGMTAEEADDFISEHGTGVTPQQVYGWHVEDMEERARAAELALPNSTTGGQDFDKT